jgi:hypothetical protein
MTGDQITTHPLQGDTLAGALLRPGDALEVWAGGQWVRGRYEVGRPGQALISVSFDPAGRLETVLPLDRATMRFRRPPAQDDETPADTVRRQAGEIAELRDQLREVRRAAWAALRGSEEGHAEALRAITELVERVVGKA